MAQVTIFENILYFNSTHCFIFRLELNETGRYISAKVIHYEAGTVLQASTSEWAIKKQLYKTKDTSAYINLARVLAQRCLESGLFEMRCDITGTSDGKIGKFLETLKEGGVVLSEPERFLPHRPWDAERPEKPWDITE